MNYRKVIILCLVTILIGVAALYSIISNQKAFNTPTETTKQSKQNTLQTQSATVGIVTYKVTPKPPISNSETWDFDVSLDTHTGSLDQDLVSMMSVVDDKGKEYAPTTWLGDPPGGHHREGVLQFKSLGPDITSVTLKIKPGENKEEVRLTWNI